MQGLRNETKLLCTLKFFTRNNSTKAKKNLYDVLCLTPKATSADIKSQYYKLSKIFHPDVNVNNVDAADKFREISEAYEVLGSYRLRKLYDRGIIHTAGRDYSRHSDGDHQKTQPYDESVEGETDDPSTRFYKSRLSKHHTTGSSKIYNFDEWTAGHYGETFKKSQKTKKKQAVYRDREFDKNAGAGNKNITMLMIGLVIAFVCLAEFTYQNVDKIQRLKKKDDED